MIHRGDFSEKAVEGSDFNSIKQLARSVCKHGSSSMGVGEDQHATGRKRRGNVERVIGALKGLTAAGWCLDRGQGKVTVEKKCDVLVRHSFSSPGYRLPQQLRPGLH